MLVQCLEDCWTNIANNLPSTEQAKKKKKKIKKMSPTIFQSPNKQQTLNQSKIRFFSLSFFIVFNRLSVVYVSFCGLTKGISLKRCILCVRVKTNKRLFEPFGVWILFLSAYDRMSNRHVPTTTWNMVDYVLKQDRNIDMAEKRPLILMRQYKTFRGKPPFNLSL